MGTFSLEFTNEALRPAAQAQEGAPEEMMQPLGDRVLVLMDESLPNQAGIILKPDTSKWRAKDGAIEGWNRGTVVRVGPGKPHPKSGVLLKPTVNPGDVVRFSELEYPSERIDGREYVLIHEGDIEWVEEAA